MNSKSDVIHDICHKRREGFRQKFKYFHLKSTQHRLLLTFSPPYWRNENRASFPIQINTRSVNEKDWRYLVGSL